MTLSLAHARLFACLELRAVSGHVAAWRANRLADRLPGLRMATLVTLVATLAIAVGLVAITTLAIAAMNAKDNRQASEQVNWALRVAGLSLVDQVPASSPVWNARGQLDSLVLSRPPVLSDLRAADWLGAAMGGQIGLLQRDPGTQSFSGRLLSPSGDYFSTVPVISLGLENGGSLVPLNAAAGDFNFSHILLEDADGAVLGILVAAMDKSLWQGPSQADTNRFALLALLALVLTSALAAMVIGRVLAPLPALAGIMGRISDGDFERPDAIVGLDRETRIMAEAAELYRRRSGNILSLAERISTLEADIRAERAASRHLALDLGKVLSAAGQGDFSLRVEADCSATQLHGVPQKLNALLDTCQRSLGATGAVLDGMAGSDLSVRASGDFNGLFGSLQRDANAVADQMAALVAQLRSKAYGLRAALEEANFAMDQMGDLAQRRDEGLGRSASALRRSRQQAHDIDAVLESFSFAGAPVVAPRNGAYRVSSEYSHSFGGADAPRLAVVGGRDWPR